MAHKPQHNTFVKDYHTKDISLNQDSINWAHLSLWTYKHLSHRKNCPCFSSFLLNEMFTDQEICKQQEPHPVMAFVAGPDLAQRHGRQKGNFLIAKSHIDSKVFCFDQLSWISPSNFYFLSRGLWHFQKEQTTASENGLSFQTIKLPHLHNCVKVVKV